MITEFIYIYIYIAIYNINEFWDPLFIYCLCQTDTASVLSEAIEYIKFLHEQVTVTPITHYSATIRLK